jgi:potassium-transporting ATPase KdpC subunit
MRRQLLTGLIVTVVLTVLLGGVYPLIVWGVGRVALRHQTDGSFVSAGGKVVGSSLIGQNFSDKDGNPLVQYFQPRPSAAGTNGYDPTSSGATNYAPSSEKLLGPCNPVPDTNADGTPKVDAQGNPVYKLNPDGTKMCDPNTVPQRVIAYRQFNGLAADVPVPVDAVTASGSGLDPDISEANALDQAARGAKARNLAADRVVALVHSHLNNRAWGFLGENTVNVLNLNLALDRLAPAA